MDYEKEYNESFRRAKELHEAGNALTKNQMEIIFPELKESEDERIRKEIIDFLLNGIWNNALIDKVRQTQKYASWISYLERQKERGPLSKDEEYTLARIIEYLEDNDCPSEWKDLLHDVYTLPYQKDQQPAEWSEEDEEMLKDIIRGIKATEHIVFTHDAQGRTQMQARVNWLKSLRPQSRWKPSEEQIQALTVAVDEAKRCDEPYWRESLHDVLLSLHADLKKLL